MSEKTIGGKELTQELIISKTKAPNLDSIKNLNLWGNQLENLSILQKMPNLEVISLSVNKICSLRDFRHCYKLQELYLRKNSIADLKEIKYLMKLPVLKVLWLHDNACAQIVIRHLPKIQKLDNNPVTPEERNAAMSIKPFIACYSEDEKPQPSKKEQSKLPQVQQKLSHFQKQEKLDPSSEVSRNKNILMAVLSLMKELDVNSLEIVKREADSLAGQYY